MSRSRSDSLLDRGSSWLRGGFDSLEERLDRTYLRRSLPLALVLLLVELAVFPFSYASSFVTATSDWVLLSVQAVALAPVIGFAVAVVVSHVGWLGGRLPLAAATWARWAALAFMACFGLAIAGNAPGRLVGVGPLWSYGLVAALVAALWWWTRLSRLPEGSRAKFAAELFAVLLFLVWLVAHDAVDFYFGRFGFRSAKQSVWSALLLVVVWTSVMAPGAMVRLDGWSARAGSRSSRGFGACCWTGWLLAVGLFSLAGAVFWATGHFYVDNYLELHSWLLLLGVASAWYGTVLVLGPTRRPGSASSTVGVGLRSARAFRSSGLTLLSLAVSLGLLVGIGIRTNVGYVGSIHTVMQRAGLELVYGDVPSMLSWPGRRLRFLWNRYERFRGRALPVDRQGRLPSTFAPMEQHPSLVRRDLRGLVIFFLDRKRPQDLGPYDQPGTTPRISACFRDAFRFDHCLSAGTCTEVSFPAIYTSTYASTRWQRRGTNLRRPYWFAYQKGYNLPKVFERAGFTTTVVTNRWYYEVFFTSPLKTAMFGGFDHIVRDDPKVSDLTESLRHAYRATGGLVPSSGRYLLVFHIQVHGLAKMNEVDSFVGDVCDEIRKQGRWNDTVLLLTSDHGVQFREHGRTNYGHTLFEEEARVPVLLRIPGMRGRHVSEPISSLDHLPTFVDLFGMTEHFEVEGRSYLPLLAGSEDPGSSVSLTSSQSRRWQRWREAWNRRFLFTETRKHFQSAAMLQGRLKLIWWAKTGAMALFDLRTDPHERRNLIDSRRYDSARRRLWWALHQFLAQRNELHWPW
ncbi:MAG: sulfatase-like hydrolase/transferase [Deltaproteobacteria bacterium]|nr:sulfatase-like hydrolase/transferase [Deltaproteobacteria bacterium]